MNNELDKLFDSLNLCTKDKVRTLEEICFLQQEKIDMLEKSIDNLNANFDKVLENMFKTEYKVKQIWNALADD